MEKNEKREETLEAHEKKRMSKDEAGYLER